LQRYSREKALKTYSLVLCLALNYIKLDFSSKSRAELLPISWIDFRVT
jgi:hypothetical protein